MRKLLQKMPTQKIAKQQDNPGDLENLTKNNLFK